jgi:hypothetical protein
MKVEALVFALIFFLLLGCAGAPIELVKTGMEIRIEVMSCPMKEAIENTRMNIDRISLPIDAPEEACEIATQVWTSLCKDFQVISCEPGSGEYDKWMPELNVSCSTCPAGSGMSVGGAYFFINKTTGETGGVATYGTVLLDPRFG